MWHFVFRDDVTASPRLQVCKRLGEAGANIMVGVVGVQEYGDKLNEDLAKRFAVQKESFPVYKLFLAGSSVPIAYTGEVVFVESLGWRAVPCRLTAWDR